MVIHVHVDNIKGKSRMPSSSNQLLLNGHFRKFYSELSLQESSLEGICSTFIHHGAEFKCYIPFLSNLDRGLHVLTSYGGSFFTDKQHEIGDELSLIERYSHPKQRLIDYDRYLKEIFMCSQKEYLHGVSIVKVSSFFAVSVCVLVAYIMYNVICMSLWILFLMPYVISHNLKAWNSCGAGMHT